MVPSKKSRKFETPFIADEAGLTALEKLIEKISAESSALSEQRILAETEKVYAHRSQEEIKGIADEKVKFQSKYEKFNWYVKFSDGSSIGPVELSTVLGSPNRAKRRITQIKVENGNIAGIHFSLEIAADSYRTVEYDISGDDPRVQYYAELLEAWLDQVQPWYKYTYSRFALELGSSLITIYIVAEIVNHLKPTTSDNDKIKGILLLSFTGFWFFCGLLFLLRKYLLPLCIFAIGSNREIKTRLKWIQGVIGGFVIVSLLKAIYSLVIP